MIILGERNNKTNSRIDQISKNSYYYCFCGNSGGGNSGFGNSGDGNSGGGNSGVATQGRQLRGGNSGAVTQGR